MFARYQTFDYPYASKIKPALMNVISEYYNGNPVRGGGKRTNQDLHKKGIIEVDKLLLWIIYHTKKGITIHIGYSQLSHIFRHY